MMGVGAIRSLLIDLVAPDDDMGPRQVADVQRACAIVEDMTSSSVRVDFFLWASALSAGVH